MLISLFERCMKRRNVKESDPFDWEKPTGDSQPISQVSQVQPPTTTPTTLARQTTKLLTTTENNQENIEPTDNKEVSFYNALFSEQLRNIHLCISGRSK